jgi:hypothetical protein
VRDRRHVVYPFVLVGTVAAVSFVKSDNGPMIGLTCAALVLFVQVIRAESRRILLRRKGGRTGRVFANNRRWLVTLTIALVAAYVVVQFVPYVSTRFAAGDEPWAVAWSAPCEKPKEGVLLPEVPDGLSVCLQAKDAVTADAWSQLARGLGAIADGGLWGRGMADVTSKEVPLGSSDFVLAVIWSKLGGVVVVLLTGLLALLASALVRTARQLLPYNVREAPRNASIARYFAVAVAALLVAQFGYVLLATLSIVPHSGITVPFLSRGGHSTIALGCAVIWAMCAIHLARPKAPVDPKPGRSWAWLPGVSVLMAGILAVWIAVVPYDGHDVRRPYCLEGEARVDAAECSTDEIAHQRTKIDLLVGGTPQYTRDRTTGRWNEAVAEPVIGLRDLAGLAQVDDDAGVVEASLRDLVHGSTGLESRLLPPGSQRDLHGSVELSIDPDVQRAAATALRTDADGAGPLAGGIVALDVTTGKVLAAASAPTAFELPETQSTSTSSVSGDKFNEENKKYGVLREDGSIDMSRQEECEREWDSKCWRWHVTQTGAAGNGAARASADEDRRRYVGGSTTAPLPETDQNRALGRRYGLGSTFKVVVAAAYLREPGRSSSDLVSSPPVLDIGGARVENANKAECPGTSNGRISIATALAVSCNTAFVVLADRLGWPKIRDTAKDLGFVVGSTSTDAPAWTAGPALGQASVVPETPDEQGLGNNALGGGDVEGTPLQMATVFAAVANGGSLVRPSLVTATTEPFGGPRTEVRGEARRVLTQAQADELWNGLAGTVEPGGTASKLPPFPGRELRVKTGTHVQTTRTQDAYVTQVSWLAGAFDTKQGRVAFAVAVEAGDDAHGAQRTRWLAQQVITKIAEVRG